MPLRGTENRLKTEHLRTHHDGHGHGRRSRSTVHDRRVLGIGTTFSPPIVYVDRDPCGVTVTVTVTVTDSRPATVSTASSYSPSRMLSFRTRK